QADPFQGADHREEIPGVHAPSAASLQGVEDAAIRKAKAVPELPRDDLADAGAIVEPARRRGVAEKPVGPGGTRHRGVPVVANDELLGERIQDGKPWGAVTIHDLLRV